MSWDDILLDSAGPGHRLPGEIDALLENQRATWKAFREGEAALTKMRSKSLAWDNARIILQANPGRHESIHAKVDPLSVSKRPCFLCIEAIDPDERGIGFGDLVLLPNPHPILSRHLTVPAREHNPQRLEGRVESFLDLARSVGPDMLVLYNGARCGASAPDHFHFQACSSFGVPLLEETSSIIGRDDVVPMTSFGRRMLVYHDGEAVKVCELIHRVLEVLSRVGGSDDEALINLIAVYRDERYGVFVFPRAKHRPECYFADGDSRISVSPAALEMAGIMVVADGDHFDRVDERRALSIYEEVTLERELFIKLAESVS